MSKITASLRAFADECDKLSSVSEGRTPIRGVVFVMQGSTSIQLGHYNADWADAAGAGLLIEAAKRAWQGGEAKETSVPGVTRLDIVLDVKNDVVAQQTLLSAADKIPAAKKVLEDAILGLVEAYDLLDGPDHRLARKLCGVYHTDPRELVMLTEQLPEVNGKPIFKFPVAPAWVAYLDLARDALECLRELDEA